jgi:hypothetical protein
VPSCSESTQGIPSSRDTTVLRSAAVRAAHEIAWMREETAALLAYARRVGARHGSEPLRAALADAGAGPADSLHLADVADCYERAGRAFAAALAAAQEAGAEDLVARAREVLRDRIATEKEVMATYAVVGR